MNDIPLINAMYLWNPINRGDGKMIVVNDSPLDDREEMLCSGGSCWAYWKELTDDQRRSRLMMDAFKIVLLDGIHPKTAHQALFVIPEYREMFRVSQMELCGHPDFAE